MIEIPQLVGLTEEEAIEKSSTWKIRVRQRDGVGLMGTCDYRTDRLNFTIVDGIVTKVNIG